MKLRTFACLLPIAIVGCGPEPGAGDQNASENAPISWEEYKQSAHRGEIDGKTFYIVEWDQAVSEEELRRRYADYVASLGTSHGDLGEVAQRSAVDTSPGRDNIFHGQQMNLTYCVSNDFGWYKPRAVSEMASATGSWEWSGRVHFAYLPSEDGNCSNANPSIMIAVRPLSDAARAQNAAACAQYPIPEASSVAYCPARTLQIGFAEVERGQALYWPNKTSLGVFKHELGHMLGFRHETGRVEGCVFWGGEALGVNIRNLTPYDTDSVMHYPGECGVPMTKPYEISNSDITGLRRLYGEQSNKLFWHNSDGPSQIWNMTWDGMSRVNYIEFPSSLNTSESQGWKPIGLADFNKDGLTDIVWHHTSGATSFWYLNGVNLIGSGFIDGSTSWGVPDSGTTRMVGFGDFNKDGNPDIIVHDSAGTNRVWYMDGATPVSSAPFSNLLNFADSTGWRLEAVTDFNHDGTPDWFMHNGNTGAMKIWYVSGITLHSVGYLDGSLNIPDSSEWSMLGAYDYNRDGSPDLIWHHSSGMAGYWFMEGTTVLGMNTFSDPMLQIPDSWNWKIIRR